jgi:hypothetical protein
MAVTVEVDSIVSVHVPVPGRRNFRKRRVTSALVGRQSHYGHPRVESDHGDMAWDTRASPT